MLVSADHIKFLRKWFGQASTLLLCLIFFLPSYDASVFAYIPKMENLLVIQRHVIVCANLHLPHLGDAEKRTIQRYITRWQEEHIKAMVNTTRYLENPINAYTLVRRLALDLNNIENILTWNRFKEYKRKRNLVYPTDHDIKGANAAFIHLIIIYKLNITELANGTLISNFNKGNKPFIEYVSPMTTSDCYELAQAALKLTEYEIAVAWAQEAFHKYPQDCIEICYFTDWDIIEFISQLYADVGEYQKSLHWLEIYNKEELTPLQLDEYESEIKLLKNKIETQKDTQKVKQMKSKIPILRQKWVGKSNVLCFAEEGTHSSNLTCQYKFGPDPFLRLARLKAEALHLEPEITLFHDVISDDEISAIQKLAEEKFQIDENADFDTSMDDNDDFLHLNCQGTMSVSQLMRHVACFPPLRKDVWPLVALHRRATDISGFDDALVIPTQMFVSSYGVAGYHNPHHDENEFDPLPPLGTVLYYLDEGQEGGATIFTELNVSVFPKKNSALYFKNMLPSGRKDQRSVHASCPVLHGSKWIISRWIGDYIKKFIY